MEPINASTGSFPLHPPPFLLAFVYYFSPVDSVAFLSSVSFFVQFYCLITMRLTTGRDQRHWSTNVILIPRNYRADYMLILGVLMVVDQGQLELSRVLLLTSDWILVVLRAWEPRSEL